MGNFIMVIISIITVLFLSVWTVFGAWIGEGWDFPKNSRQWILTAVTGGPVMLIIFLLFGFISNSNFKKYMDTFYNEGKF